MFPRLYFSCKWKRSAILQLSYSQKILQNLLSSCTRFGLRCPRMLSKPSVRVCVKLAAWTSHRQRCWVTGVGGVKGCLSRTLCLTLIPGRLRHDFVSPVLHFSVLSCPCSNLLRSVCQSKITASVVSLFSSHLLGLGVWLHAINLLQGCHSDLTLSHLFHSICPS